MSEKVLVGRVCIDSGILELSDGGGWMPEEMTKQYFSSKPTNLAPEFHAIEDGEDVFIDTDGDGEFAVFVEFENGHPVRIVIDLEDHERSEGEGQ